MNKTTFRIDLGGGDSIDMEVTSEGEYTIFDMTEYIRTSGEWVVINNTSIQKTHIKRIVEL